MVFRIYSYAVLILLTSFLHMSQEQSDCVLEDFPKTRTFSSMNEYQSSRNSFNPHHFGYQGNVVAFSFKKLEVIPKNSFISFGSEGIVELNLQNKQIRQIDGGAFLELDCLHELNLNNNSLTDIAEGTFEGLDQLKNLLLSNNLLESTPDTGMAFLHLTNLKILDLSRNRIKTIQRIAFDALKNLEVLNLGYNRIRCIDDTTFNAMDSLNTLLLNNNYLTTIAPHRWANLGRLSYLNLAENFIPTFDAGYNISFSNLTKLNLSGNALSALDGTEIKKFLPHLEQLDIGNNLWTCENLNAFRSDIYGSKVQLTQGIKCTKKDQISWSIPTPPPEDLDEPFRNTTHSFIDSVRKNISQQVRQDLELENKKVMVRLSYIQNVLTFLSITTVICFFFIIIVKLQACQVLANYFYRQNNYIDRTYISANDSETYRLMGR